MTFRPYPGFTIFAGVAIALLSALGFWQLERLQWKLDLIATVDQKIHAPAVPLEALRQGADASYTHVTVQGRLLNDRETYLFGTADEGAPVYHVIAPLRTDDGKVWLVDRGIVPKEKLDPATRRAGQPENAVQVTGIWRQPDLANWFTPPADTAHRIWYWHDLKAMAAADGMTLAAPGILEADATPNPGGWPRGGQTVVTFRNQHLSYAVTWFGLALGLFGVWLAYHISRGRIALK